MIDPTQQKADEFLWRETTSLRALMRAWHDVKGRVIHSNDPRTRSDAEQFAADPERNIRQLQKSLRSGKFQFAAQRGILKIKRSAPGEARKPPRPIVASPLPNRVVQRAILNTCQSDDPKIRRRLGKLPEVIATPTSVGGLPGRGVPEAMAMIRQTIASGTTWFVRSDLKAFFQHIPKPRVEEFLRANLAGPSFVDWFMKTLATELENEDEVRAWLDLFPLGEEGVPQGSALSALCANIVLQTLDAELNCRGLTTLRYLDDFLILGRSRRAVELGFQRAQAILAELGMECHDPGPGSKKAAKGHVTEGFEFLSFHIDQNDIYPSTAAQTAFLENFRVAVRHAKAELASVENQPRRAEPRFIQCLAQLDSEIGEILDDFQRWFRRRYSPANTIRRRRLLGVALLGDTEHIRPPPA